MVYVIVGIIVEKERSFTHSKDMISRIVGGLPIRNIKHLNAKSLVSFLSSEIVLTFGQL